MNYHRKNKVSNLETGVTLFLLIAGFGLIFAFGIILLVTRYKRCASDEILVVYGRVSGGKASKCIHGGATLVWPLIQDWKKLSLIPMTINIPLTNALSIQNIRINVPSTFTVGISTDPLIMNNAAERLLHLKPPEIESMASEIIFGQLRLTVASLTIEQINKERDLFLEQIRDNVGHELNKIGLNLINVNITDITDDSEYIESIGKKAAAGAVNAAKKDVADADRDGAIGQAAAYQTETFKLQKMRQMLRKERRQQMPIEEKKLLFLKLMQSEERTPLKQTLLTLTQTWLKKKQKQCRGLKLLAELLKWKFKKLSIC